MASYDSNRLKRAKQKIDSYWRYFSSEIDLSEFDLSTDEFKQIIPKLRKFKFLKRLNLSNNKLTSIPPEIEQLTNLILLNLRNNELTEISQKIIQLKKLKVLILDSNKLNTFPNEIVQLKELKKLYLGNNQLTKIPLEIEQLIKLKVLDLDKNKFASFPLEIILLKKLTKLYLGYNQLKEIPPEIIQLEQLLLLSLNHNLLEVLPREIGELSNLIRLDIDNNKLVSIPSEIIQLQKLVVLILSSNKFTTFPPQIASLKNLLLLDLSNNQLATINPEIKQLKKLEILDLENNKLIVFPTEIVQLDQLTTLNLNNNKLTEVPRDIIEQTELEKLFLARNPLSEASRSFLVDFSERYYIQVFLKSKSTYILETLYPSASEQEIFEMDSHLGKLYQKTDFQDGRVPSNIINGTEVIDDFSIRIYADQTNRGPEVTEYYHQAARHLIEQALIEDEQTVNATLTVIASSLGNCPSPVNDLLEKTIVGLILDRGEKISITLETMMHRQAFEHEIKKAKIPLGVDESIETINGLTNALFLISAETDPNNPIRIAGKRNRIPPKNTIETLDFAYNLINKPEIIEVFAKLCCQTNPKGDLMVNKNGQFLLDPFKYKVITEYYMAGLGIFSERETANANFRRQIESLVPDNFSIEHFDNDHAMSLIDFPDQENKHRQALARVPDDKITETAQKLLEDYKSKIEIIEQELESVKIDLETIKHIVKESKGPHQRRGSNSTSFTKKRGKRLSI